VTERKTRAELLKSVGNDLGREVATASLFFHALVAGKLGLNATDMRSLELITRSGTSLITAGELTKATGFTTGAVTGILDRLEKAGFVERVKDATDRRKVLVRPLPRAGLKLRELYKELGAEMGKLAASYETRELDLIEGFLKENLRILKAQISEISARS
jgi:DNA-binding MarR family transcriptional regulator